MSLNDEDFRKLEDMVGRRIDEAVMRGIGVYAEDVGHKFEILAEGQQMLSERMDRLDAKLDAVEVNLSRRIDAIAVDLSGHRADTEAHHGVYRVKEE